ncbi:MAG TPA: CocE/NonD family hydrolase [Solirubrobacteraceae bacterium]|nr:CocE/NonD family hydrolase [Solirubrobacteraceae bacterium]
MRDGTLLRADVYRPAGDGRRPVLLQRTPYNKEQWALTALTLDPVRAAAAGFVVVTQDVRGRFASDGGPFSPYRDERADGHDAVRWASALPHGNGRVGAHGVSYAGAAAWHAAAASPPALGAISATTAPNDSAADHLWRGGAFLLGTLVMWSLQSIGLAAVLRAHRGTPDLVPSLVRLAGDIDGFDRWTRHRPLRTFPPARPEDPALLPFFFEIMDHPTRDDFTRARSVSADHGRVRVPALILAGWHDLLLAADLQHYRALREEGATEAAREGTRLVVGPWSHGMFLNVVGEVDFGLRASGLLLDLREDLTTMQLRWFGHWLADDGGAAPAGPDGPRVRLFVQGVNRWRDEDDWPPAGVTERRLHLRAERRLSFAPPETEEPADAYVYDPEQPCPTRGGTLLMPRQHPAGPVDQAPLLARRDVLCYTSEPLERDLQVVGHVRAMLHAATTARDTDWVVKLCRVDAAGVTRNVCDGILRASYRRSDAERHLVEPGAVERYEVDLWATAIVFGAGERLRVLVTSSDFPRYDRNPNTGELGVAASTSIPALQRIFHDAERPSHVVLPVLDGP